MRFVACRSTTHQVPGGVSSDLSHRRTSCWGSETTRATSADNRRPEHYGEAIGIIKRGIANYTIEQERKAAEERRKAEEATAERAALEARARELETAAKKEEATEEERA